MAGSADRAAALPVQHELDDERRLNERLAVRAP
jgi:hypothetical protein